MFEAMHLNNQIHQSYIQFISLLIGFDIESPYFKLLTSENNLTSRLLKWIGQDRFAHQSHTKKGSNLGSGTWKSLSGNFGHLRIIGNLILAQVPEK